MFETLAMLKHGGLLMLPLGLCSLAAVTIIIERAVALRRPAVIDPQLIQVVAQYDGEASADKAVLACRRSRGPFARLVEELIRLRHVDRARLVEAMHIAGRAQVGKLERGLTMLEIIAGASPLLGLLGTVVGMINVFNAITVKGIGNPQVLSDGISKALITTVVGLSVAIPALAAHSWFSRRIEDYAIEMEERATAFIARLCAIRAASKQSR